MPAPDGLLVVDKPAGWTSHDVVGRARRLCATRKVGHAGTLDPMATGVLVLGIGRATRLLTFLVGCDKDYTATIRLGQATVTDDAEGEVTATAAGRRRHRGARCERPWSPRSPATSSRSRARCRAIKVKGERVLPPGPRRARTSTLAARPVTVSRFEVLGDPRRPTRTAYPCSTSTSR